ncbi:ejaculatory bulb-specific protein 3 [Hetaerina americana]|uniref:ejaculatory bulb-specific protein 3 n=1 Tax=Hetaerina americana TaxID=62018 RepID=UPI003A7F1F14
MNSWLILVLLVATTIQLTVGQAGNSDITPLINNPALVQRQIRCVLDQGPCDTTGQQIKAAIPEVLGRKCASCSPTQAANARKVINFVQQRYPSVWSAIQARYSG